jgi:hypothetical protein
MTAPDRIPADWANQLAPLLANSYPGFLSKKDGGAKKAARKFPTSTATWFALATGAIVLKKFL